MGSNMASAMRDYIRANVAGIDSCGGSYALLYVYLWKQGSAERWSGNTTPKRFQSTTSSQIDRVTLTRWEAFKFYDSTFSFPNSSQIYGYWTSLSQEGDGEPLPGPPSTSANTVHVVE